MNKLWTRCECIVNYNKRTNERKTKSCKVHKKDQLIVNDEKKWYI